MNNAIIVGLAASLLLAAPLAYAKDDGGDGQQETSTDESGEASRDTSEPREVVACEEGEVFHNILARCVDAADSGLDDQSLLDIGRDLALAGHYAEALPVLAAADQDNLVVLTYQGFALRKLGRIEEGFAFYEAALAIDPNSVLTLSYMGEGYVALDRPEDAWATLTRIRDICGAECPEYVELAAAIDSGVSTAW